MNKVLQKRQFILTTALSLVRKLGFESVSIANLAKEVGMSKSGLFAHFNSKEKMHIMILDHAAQSFTQGVIVKSISEPRGLPRLRTLIKNWIRWYGKEMEGSCPFIAAGVEFDQKPGQVKDRLQLHLDGLVHSIEKAVNITIEEGHFAESTNSKIVAYEIYSLVIGAQIYHRTLMRINAREILIKSLEDLYQRNSG